MFRAADEGTSTPILAQHSSFHMGPRFYSHVRVCVCMCYCHFIATPHLVTNCHVCLANIVCVSKICPLVPIHQCQSMKPLNCVGHHAATKRDVVLGTCSHTLQMVTELLSLCLTGKSVFGLVGLTINLLCRLKHARVHTHTQNIMCFIWNILQSLSWWHHSELCSSRQ